jgi:hypothetical protein
MQTEYREIYSSSNGDRWLLARRPDSGKVFIRHEANSASGGFGTQVELDVFLTQNKSSPQAEHRHCHRKMNGVQRCRLGASY